MKRLSEYNKEDYDLKELRTLYLVNGDNVVIMPTFHYLGKAMYMSSNGKIGSIDEIKNICKAYPNTPFFTFDKEKAYDFIINKERRPDNEYIYGMIVEHLPQYTQSYRSVHYKGKLIGFYRGQSCTKYYYCMRTRTHFEITRSGGQCSMDDLKIAIPWLETLDSRPDESFAFDITFLDTEGFKEKFANHVRKYT